MAKYKLAISIPTYDRADSIDLMLNEIINITEELKIGVYIFDGSPNDETKKICEKYKNYTCLNYISHTGEAKKRHWEAAIIPDCDYLWICRDRSILKSEFYGIILRLLEENYDVMVIADIINNSDKKMHLMSSPCDLFKYYLLSMTLFGSYIVKKEILELVNKSIEAKYYKSFALLSKVFQGIAKKKDFKALNVPFDYKQNSFIIPNTNRLTPEQLFDIWGDDWIKMIDDLPPCYNEYKEKAKHARDIDFWKFYSILDLRMHGSIDLKNVIKYHNVIKQVSSNPLLFFIFAGLIPQKLVKPFIKIFKPITNIFESIWSKISKEINNAKKSLKKKNKQ